MEGVVVATVVMEANDCCVNNGYAGWLWKWWLRYGGDGGVHDEGNGVENVMMAVMVGGGGGGSNDGEIVTNIVEVMVAIVIIAVAYIITLFIKILT